MNIQLGKTIGGLSFFDSNYENDITEHGKSPIHWIETDLTNEAFKKDSKILKINSKTGLYPLYAAVSLYKKAFDHLNNSIASKFSLEDEQCLWQEILKNNIFVIAKTPMAKMIVQRTLCGFKDYETNIKYIDHIVEDAKEDLDKEVERINKEFNVMKFDVVIGNPSYQKDAKGESNSQRTYISLFYEFIIQTIFFIHFDYSCKIFI